MLDLKQTYQAPDLHDKWTSIYRTDPLQQQFNSAILKRLLALLPKAPASFLDAGCGTGDHAMRFLQAGYTGVAVDLSATALQRARQRTQQHAEPRDMCVNFVQGNLEALPLASGSFDFVHCRGVLMHIPDWEMSLRNLCRVLKPGGIILVMDNNDRSLEARLRLLARKCVKHSSRLVNTGAGPEFWSEVNGQPFLWRIANMDQVAAVMQECGVSLLRVLPMGFFEISSFAAGWVRDLVIQFNRLYFAARLPASPSMEVILVGHKN